MEKVKSSSVSSNKMDRKIIRVAPAEIPHKLQPSMEDFAVVKKNSRSRAINFSTSLLPAYFFSRVIGLIPFSIVRDSNGDAHTARINLFDLLWFIFSILLYLFLAFYRYSYMDIPQDASKSYILVIGDSLLLIFGIIYGALMIVMDMFNRNRLVDILKKFTIFDKEVNLLIHTIVFSFSDAKRK